MKLIAYEIGPETTEEEIVRVLEPLGKVLGVEIIREGDADKPAALIEMDVTPGEATSIAEHFERRLTTKGEGLRLHVLPEQR
ncbi:MAG: hypothetical protein R3298_05965 [Gammaproteobacteria bacterium]|nr:hypothetical protein [Gammaproteobacteria bacterium]